MRTAVKTVNEKSLQVLEKELDDVFSDFIRMRDSENGFVKCFVCGRSVRWKEAHNGHYVSRSKMPTRYNEINCHAICSQCNCFDENHEVRYKTRLVMMYGLDVVINLEILGRSLQKFMRSDLIEKIEFYREKVKELRKRKGL